MIKKIEPSILIAITVMFIGLMVGLFIGRYTKDSSIKLTDKPNTSAQIEQIDTTNDASSGKLDINTATAEQLTALPGIGEVYAQRIVEYRTTYGKFISIYDLEKVKGIGQKRIEAIADYITVGG